jgi:esterase/lipase superfamily enzyme
MHALLGNWDGIRLRMGVLTPALERQLQNVAQRLASAQSADELAVVTDDLLELTRDTPAHDFVRDLVARSSLVARVSTRSEPKIASGMPQAIAEIAPVFAISDGATTLGKGLGRRMADTASAQTRPVVVPVFFATNRNPLPNTAPEDAFGGELAGLSYGVAAVSIPVATHRLGKVETPHWWTPFPGMNTENRFVVIANLEGIAEDRFTQRLIEAGPQDGSRDIMIFLHGYNVTFEAAARRAAQVAFDLEFRGVVVLFSWPSLGTFLGYVADGARAEASAQPLSRLLQVLGEGPWGNVHMLAHSMGNRVMFAGLADHAAATLPLREIVLVAADLEVTLFQQKFDRFAAGKRSVTSYASKSDLALVISSWFNQARRVGYVDGEPFCWPGMDTVDATNVDTSLLGHSYFGDERPMLADLGNLLGEGLPAASRHGLKRDPAGRYWLFPR